MRFRLRYYLRDCRYSSIKTQSASKIMEQTENKWLAIKRLEPDILGIQFCLKVQDQHSSL